MVDRGLEIHLGIFCEPIEGYQEDLKLTGQDVRLCNQWLRYRIRGAIHKEQITNHRKGPQASVNPGMLR